jgi:hypothetical protein
MNALPATAKGISRQILACCCIVCIATIFILVFPKLTEAAPFKFLASYFSGKVLDEMFDKATGKPDIYQLERRLREVEKAVNQIQPGLGYDVRILSEVVNSQTTRPQFVRLLQVFDDRLTKLETEIKDVKKRLSKLESGDSDDESLESGSVCCDEDGWVYVRNGPGTEYVPIGVLNVGTEVSFEEGQGAWRILHQPVYGYMHSSRIR